MQLLMHLCKATLQLSKAKLTKGFCIYKRIYKTTIEFRLQFRFYMHIKNYPDNGQCYLSQPFASALTSYSLTIWLVFDIMLAFNTRTTFELFIFLHPYMLIQCIILKAVYLSMILYTVYHLLKQSIRK